MPRMPAISNRPDVYSAAPGGQVAREREASLSAIEASRLSTGGNASPVLDELIASQRKRMSGSVGPVDRSFARPSRQLSANLGGAAQGHRLVAPFTDGQMRLLHDSLDFSGPAHPLQPGESPKDPEREVVVQGGAPPDSSATLRVGLGKLPDRSSLEPVGFTHLRGGGRSSKESSKGKGKAKASETYELHELPGQLYLALNKARAAIKKDKRYKKEKPSKYSDYATFNGQLEEWFKTGMSAYEGEGAGAIAQRLTRRADWETAYPEIAKVVAKFGSSVLTGPSASGPSGTTLPKEPATPTGIRTKVLKAVKQGLREAGGEWHARYSDLIQKIEKGGIAPGKNDSMEEFIYRITGYSDPKYTEGEAWDGLVYYYPALADLLESPPMSGVLNALNALDATNREMASQVYQENVLYHYASLKSKAFIQEHGFDIEKKGGGFTADRLIVNPMTSPQFVADAKTHHFAFTDATSARDFGLSNLLATEAPGIVRFFKGNAKFENDPDFGAPEALRTANDIPSANILGSRKSSPTSAESELMRQGLVRKGVHVDQREAGRLLRDVQSDSEDDFDIKMLHPRVRAEFLASRSR